VTVALDTDVEAARPFTLAAKPTHPSLVDQGLITVELFGITNVPFGLWIDENGTIVRPAEVAFAAPGPGRRDEAAAAAATAHLSPEQRSIVEGMLQNVTDRGRYTDALRDWVANGARSAFALPPAEVVARSRPRPHEFGLAAAHF